MSLLLIKNGRVIDPANKVDSNVDVLVRDGIVAEVGKVTTNAENQIRQQLNQI